MSSVEPKFVSIDVSREGLISSLSHQFTSKTTFIGELIQNARRAGATGVDITFDEQSRQFIIEDDGVGVEDPQVLLTLGKSGWSDLELMAQENPYGVGFASALFAAEHIEVESRGWAIRTGTKNILGMGLVSVENRATPRSGTRVVLTLKDGQYTLGELVDATAVKVRGFPLPVRFNGNEFNRPHALDGRFKETDIGHVRMEMVRNGFPRDVIAYIQGLPVSMSNRSVDALHLRDGIAIVHLDDARFRARMPDRDVLIDRKAGLQAVMEAIRLLWREHLVEEKAALGPEQFAVIYSKDARDARCEDLLDDCPLPPGEWGWYNEPPRNPLYEGESDFLTWASDEDAGSLAPGSELIQEIDRYNVDSNGLAAVYAAAKALPVLTVSGLSQSHWASKAAIDLMAETFYLEGVEGAVSAGVYSERCVYIQEVVFCDSYRIRPENQRFGEVTVSDEPVFDSESGVAYIPKQCGYGHLKGLLMQLSSYADEWGSVYEDDLEADTQALWNLMSATVGGAQDEVFRDSVVKGLGSLAGALKGAEFKVRICDEGKVHVERV